MADDPLAGSTSILTERQFCCTVGDALRKIPYIFLILSAPDYRLTYLNQATVDLLHRYGLKTPPELIGKHLWEIVPLWTERLKAVHEESRLRNEIRVVKGLCYELPSGVTHWDMLLIPTADRTTGEVTAISVLVIDTTQRVAVEEACRESELRYRALVEASPDGITVTDTDATITMVNQSILTMHEYEHADELIGRNALELIAPEDRVRASENTAKARREEVLTNIHYSLLRKNGSQFPGEMSIAPITHPEGETVGFVAISRDITERNQAEAALKNSENRYRTLVETSPDAIVVTDLHFNIMTVNQMASFYTGIATPQELVGRSAFEFILSDDIPRLIEQSKQWLKGGEVGGIEITVVDKSGNRRIVDVKVSLMIGSMSNPIGFIAVGRDITERKQAELLNAALNEMNAAISSTLDFDEIMRRVAVRAAQAIHAESSAVLVREDDFWVRRFSYGLPAAQAAERLSDNEIPLTLLLQETAEPLAITDISREERIPIIARELGISSILFVPLVIRGTKIGILAFHCDTKPRVFTDQEIDFARKLGTSVSLALGNAIRFEYERRTAHTLQKALLPGKPAIVPGYSIVTEYISAFAAQEIGGDFYDVFTTENEEIGILIGDVSGKGIEAAALAASTRSTIRAFAYNLSNAGTALSCANALLCTQQIIEDDISRPFVTVFLVILDPATGKIRYSSAGHPPAAICRRSGDVEFLLTGKPPIAVIETEEYGEEETQFGRGDKLMLYTDGLSEAHRGPKMFGTDGIARVLHENACRPLKEIVKEMVSEASAVVEGRLTDDMAILLVKRE